jgi:hypothetical protein
MAAHESQSAGAHASSTYIDDLTINPNFILDEWHVCVARQKGYFWFTTSLIPRVRQVSNFEARQIDKSYVSTVADLLTQALRARSRRYPRSGFAQSGNLAFTESAMSCI